MSARDREALYVRALAGLGAGGGASSASAVSQARRAAGCQAASAGVMVMVQLAGAELFQLPQQVGAALLGRLPPGVGIRAGVLVRLAAAEHLIGDLQQGVGDGEDGLLDRGRVLR